MNIFLKSVGSFLALLLFSCQYFSSPAPFEPFSRTRQKEEIAVATISLRFSHLLTPFEDWSLYRPEEIAGIGISPDGLQIYAGTRAGKVFCMKTKDGAFRWEISTSGSITTTPMQPTTSEFVFFASSDGNIYSVRAQDGSLQWKQPAKAAAEGELLFTDDLLLARLSDGSIMGIDQKTGEEKWVWEHGLPEGFTIEGSSLLRLARNKVLLGTADGYLFAVNIKDGTKGWSSDLGAGGDRFVDVDATPLVVDNIVYAASYSGGVYALSLDGGLVVWRQAVSGVVSLVRSEEGILYAASSEQRLYALSEKTGQVLYNVPLPIDAYGLLVAGPYLVVWDRSNGFWVIERATGRLVQQYRTGNGVRAAPTLSGSSLYVFSNRGRLYAFDLLNESTD